MYTISISRSENMMKNTMQFYKNINTCIGPNNTDESYRCDTMMSPMYVNVCMTHRSSSFYETILSVILKQSCLCYIYIYETRIIG